MSWGSPCPFLQFITVEIGRKRPHFIFTLSCHSLEDGIRMRITTFGALMTIWVASLWKVLCGRTKGPFLPRFSQRKVPYSFRNTRRREGKIERKFQRVDALSWPEEKWRNLLLSTSAFEYKVNFWQSKFGSKRIVVSEQLSSRFIQKRETIACLFLENVYAHGKYTSFKEFNHGLKFRQALPFVFVVQFSRSWQIRWTPRSC